MTVLTLHYVSCDMPSCAALTQPTPLGRGSARVEAKEQGWKRVGKGDICSWCAKQEIEREAKQRPR